MRFIVISITYSCLLQFRRALGLSSVPQEFPVIRVGETPLTGLVSLPHSRTVENLYTDHTYVEIEEASTVRQRTPLPPQPTPQPILLVQPGTVLLTPPVSRVVGQTETTTFLQPATRYLQQPSSLPPGIVLHPELACSQDTVSFIKLILNI